MIGLLDVQRLTDHLTGQVGYQITLSPPDAEPVALVLTTQQWRLFVEAGVASLLMPPDAPRLTGVPV